MEFTISGQLELIEIDSGYLGVDIRVDGQSLGDWLAEQLGVAERVGMTSDSIEFGEATVSVSVERGQA